MKLLRLTLTAALLAAVAGCGQPKKAVPTAATDSAACCGSAATGAICDTTLNLDSTAATTASGGLDLAAELALPKPKLWDFGSEKCIPCKTMIGILDPLGDEYKEEVAILVIDAYEYKDWARKYRIVTIPTQVFIDASGKEVFRHIGVYPRDSIIARFNTLGFTKRTTTATPAKAPAPATGGT
jgi:thioredoxin 1